MSVRRLPVYLLLDTSGSMKGEPIESVKVGLQSMITSLRQDPFALESVYLSIITFDREVKNVLPLTELETLQLPDIETPDSGPTHLGMAIEMLEQKIRSEIIKGNENQKGDWMPLLFIMTDGKPSDIRNESQENHFINLIKKCHFGSSIGCSAGPQADDTFLKKICNTVVHLDTTDSATFAQFFKWVSASVSSGNRSMGTGETDSALPPPPPEVHVVI